MHTVAETNPQEKSSRKRAWIWLMNKKQLQKHLPRMSRDGLRVFLVLAAHADKKTEECYPSYMSIAEVSGCSRRSVINALAFLEAEGLIHIKSRGRQHRSNRYVIVNLLDSSTMKTDTPEVQASAPEVDHEVDQSEVDQGVLASLAHEPDHCGHAKLTPSMRPRQDKDLAYILNEALPALLRMGIPLTTALKRYPRYADAILADPAVRQLVASTNGRIRATGNTPR